MAEIKKHFSLSSNVIEYLKALTEPENNQLTIDRLLTLRDSPLPDGFYKNISIHFTIGKDFRTELRELYQVKSSFDTDDEIERISNLLGFSSWRKITNMFLKLEEEFETKFKSFQNLEDIVIKQKELALNLAESLKQSNLHKYFDEIGSPFDGLLAKHSFDSNIINQIEFALSLKTKEDSDKIATGILLGISGDNSIQALSKTLSDYAEKLANSFTKEYFDKVNKLYSNKKISFKEFVKKRVFDILRDVWPNDRNPNKETATISNLILGLDGQESISPNDISQMNKKNRKKYNLF